MRQKLYGTYIHIKTKDKLEKIKTIVIQHSCPLSHQEGYFVANAVFL